MNDDDRYDPDDPDAQHIEPGLTAGEVAGDTQSLLDRIAARRDGRDDVLTIDIPSWGGEMKAKYQVLDRAEIDKMVKRTRARVANSDKNSGTDADADFLVKACVGVVGYDAESDTEFEVDGEGYTMALAGKLKPKDKITGAPIELKTPRHLVVYLTGWNNIALSAHAAKVARWMQDTSQNVEDPS